ncbi:CinA family protein [Burkholderia glumae]|uniref:CinA family protein n=1 Tax=Burkholderia glumae TaxID=337 RepID=UPI0003AA5BF3|nr:CinA family protein [Burkholderia glumae]MCM2494046.1 nicotinamide-nucleotide amidohydrolase family protein [Burkholderia glumae]MCM2544993.1 nicotinamide-nucleotide amidohydrolase family protein [Burkholderia glumae]
MDTALRAVDFLKANEIVLTTAESCTGGLIAATLASVPGCGGCLDVGFVAYSPRGKAGFLGVRHETIARHGLTSEAVAREMAEGALAAPGSIATLAVANTGLADGEHDGSPPHGTQCFAWSLRATDGKLSTFSETQRFSGSRNEIRQAAADYALARLAHYHALVQASRSEAG